MSALRWGMAIYSVFDKVLMNATPWLYRVTIWSTHPRCGSPVGKYVWERSNVETSGVHSLNMKALVVVLNILLLLQFTTIAYAFSNKISGSSNSDARI